MRIVTALLIWSCTSFCQLIGGAVLFGDSPVPDTVICAFPDGAIVLEAMVRDESGNVVSPILCDWILSGGFSSSDTSLSASRYFLDPSEREPDQTGYIVWQSRDSAYSYINDSVFVVIQNESAISFSRPANVFNGSQVSNKRPPCDLLGRSGVATRKTKSFSRYVYRD